MRFKGFTSHFGEIKLSLIHFITVALVTPAMVMSSVWGDVFSVHWQETGTFPSPRSFQLEYLKLMCDVWRGIQGFKSNVACILSQWNQNVAMIQWIAHFNDIHRFDGFAAKCRVLRLQSISGINMDTFLCVVHFLTNSLTESQHSWWLHIYKWNHNWFSLWLLISWYFPVLAVTILTMQLDCLMFFFLVYIWFE